MVEKRQYVRMSTVFPVELEIESAGEKTSPGLLQAFTRDVSAGGMCLELKSFSKAVEKLIESPGVILRLTINPSFSPKAILAVSKIVWLRKEETVYATRYLIGVSYVDIEPRSRRRLIGYAKRLLWTPRILWVAGMVLTLLVLALFWQRDSLIRENRRLVNELTQNASAKSNIHSDLSALGAKRLALEKELAAARKQVRELQATVKAAETGRVMERNLFENKLRESAENERRIEEALVNVQEGTEKLAANYETIDTRLKAAESTVLEQMVQWIESHQNVKTGLIASFEGDPKLEDWAFTYDQSLACQTFLLFGREEKARRILQFFDSHADKDNEAFFNVYDAADGRAIERQVLTGPTIWVGIAALQFENRVKDGLFLPLAVRIGDWVIREQDSEGGLKGGPQVLWYSTEHNLDAYAFLSMLYGVTQDEKYKIAADKTLSWIRQYAYSLKEKRMNRGKGDATIATDTFSWAVAAIGPERLKQIGFDAEGIMQFAEEQCAVRVDYKKTGEETQKITGFDFSKTQNVGRGGVISTEWTAQVIVTYRILSDYFSAAGDDQKARLYSEKAAFYLNELQRLVITSPSRTGQGRGCLPYASMDNAETGHGWRTPDGSRTGSVAGTAYGIFAWIGHNPFELSASPDDEKKA